MNLVSCKLEKINPTVSGALTPLVGSQTSDRESLAFSYHKLNCLPYESRR